MNHRHGGTALFVAQKSNLISKNLPFDIGSLCDEMNCELSGAVIGSVQVITVYNNKKLIIIINLLTTKEQL